MFVHIADWHFPFWSEDLSLTIQMMRKPLWTPPQALIYPELFALVERMLDPIIETRITLTQILDHPLLNLNRISASITIHNFKSEIPFLSIKSRQCCQRQGWRRRLSRLLGLEHLHKRNP